MNYKQEALRRIADNKIDREHALFVISGMRSGDISKELWVHPKPLKLTYKSAIQLRNWAAERLHDIEVNDPWDGESSTFWYHEIRVADKMARILRGRRYQQLRVEYWWANKELDRSGAHYGFLDERLRQLTKRMGDIMFSWVFTMDVFHKKGNR